MLKDQNLALALFAQKILGRPTAYYSPNRTGSKIHYLFPLSGGGDLKPKTAAPTSNGVLAAVAKNSATANIVATASAASAPAAGSNLVGDHQVAPPTSAIAAGTAPHTRLNRCDFHLLPPKVYSKWDSLKQ